MSPTKPASGCGCWRGFKHQTQVMSGHMGGPYGVAVDAEGTLYATDASNGGVYKLAVGGDSPTVLPFSNVNRPTGAAVDTAGNLYIADGQEVLKLAAGASAPTALPFPGLSDANAVAVDTTGALYVTDQDSHRFAEDDHPRVWKLAAGSNTPTLLAFPGLKEPEGVAVDTGGNLYVTDLYDNQVWKLPAGSNTPTALPFTDLQQPSYLAVDSAGNLYVDDPTQRPCAESGGGGQSTNCVAVPWTRASGWPGGRRRRHCLRHQLSQPMHGNRPLRLPSEDRPLRGRKGPQASAGFEHSLGAAVQRPRPSLGCGGGRRGRTLHHRKRRSSAEAAGTAIRQPTMLR